MKLKSYTTPERENVYKITLTSLDMITLQLNKFDRLLIEECENSSDISDKILALETIARRLEQAGKNEKPNITPKVKAEANYHYKERDIYNKAYAKGHDDCKSELKAKIEALKTFTEHQNNPFADGYNEGHDKALDDVLKLLSEEELNG